MFARVQSAARMLASAHTRTLGHSHQIAVAQVLSLHASCCWREALRVWDRSTVKSQTLEVLKRVVDVRSHRAPGVLSLISRAIEVIRSQVCHVLRVPAGTDCARPGGVFARGYIGSDHIQLLNRSYQEIPIQNGKRSEQHTDQTW